MVVQNHLRHKGENDASVAMVMPMSFVARVMRIYTFIVRMMKCWASMKRLLLSRPIYCSTGVATTMDDLAY